MMHAEDEAKTKWCPFGRLSVTDEPAANRWGNGSDQETKCIGSGCMAWRWGDKINVGHGGAKTIERGYCGLAGRPA